MIWVLTGPPGAGKGTQAMQLAAAMGWLHISTGELLRTNIQAGTPLGGEAAARLDAGMLVADETVIAMVAERLAAPDARAGVLFDGFPRTLAQAVALDEMAERLGYLPPRAVVLKVSPETVVVRLTGRRVCRAAGHPYHLVYRPPKVAGVCDVDGTELIQRADDSPETVARRLEVYEAETQPVLQYYRDRGRLTEVHGEEKPAAVAEQLLQAANG